MNSIDDQWFRIEVMQEQIDAQKREARRRELLERQHQEALGFALQMHGLAVQQWLYYLMFNPNPNPVVAAEMLDLSHILKT